MLDKQIAQGLLKTQSITLNVKEPYIWASGLKSPIYCDNRVTLSYPNIRKLITQGFRDLILNEFENVEAIVGVATGGLPQATLLADLLNLPLAYVRPQAKSHGRSKQIEGFLKPGSKVVVIEDLISTGGSVIKAVEAVKEAGYEVLGVAAIFTYELKKALDNFKEIKLKTLCNYSTLIEVAVSSNYVSEEDLKHLKSWREDPEKYNPK